MSMQKFIHWLASAAMSLTIGWGLAGLAAADETEASASIWQLIDEVPAARAAGRPNVRPEKGQTFEIDATRLWDVLDSAPREFSKAAEQPTVITLPLPEGGFGKFAIVESPIMEPELAEAFPDIRTFAGWGLDDPAASVRLDWTMHGFHAQVLTPGGSFYIDPYSMDDPQYYTSYYKRDLKNSPNARWACLVETKDPQPGSEPPAKRAARSNGTQLLTYRLANAATGEYTTFHGGTVAAGQAAVVTAINRVTGIYERDLAIRLVLVANNSSLIYTNAGSDPYTNSDASALLTENQSNITSVIGSANYDIGHVFSTGGGGLAGLGVVCVNGQKARGETGSGSPVGDPFYVDYVAHEIGHQFGANHTFNGEAGSCGGNRASISAYEPGSGSTIMAYAGICGVDDLQPNSDPYFHFRSLDEIFNHAIDGNGNACPVATATGNFTPSVSAGADYSIPRLTPFTLTASGSDANGDVVTYCWEQADLGPAQALSAADNGQSPLFRSFNPTTNPSRTFPRLSNILSNVSTNDEKLPSQARAMDFRVTIRDNRAGGGGVADDSMVANVVGGTGPFRVTYPNSAVSTNGSFTVTWDVAGTTAAPISTANVRILLSTDGGQTFPIVLLASTPNDGSEAVVTPTLNTTTARIKVEAVGNIYFDISNTNFTIVSPTNLELTGNNALDDEAGQGNNNGVPEPGEGPISVLPEVRNVTGSTATGMSGVLSSSTPGVTIVSNTQAYPDLPVSGTGLPFVPFEFALDSSVACGTVLNFTLQMSGSVSSTLYFSFTAGVEDGPVVQNYPASGLPVSIPDVSFVDSIITVPAVSGAITQVRVLNLTIPHSYSADLDISLTSPQGTTIILANDLGGSNPNAYNGTVFDANAATSIGSASVPFSGSYVPQGNLGLFIGQAATGNWRLRVADDAGADVGTLQSWALEITTQRFICDAPGSAARHSELFE
jgi:subtilisin-like proprotein convertase family protein